MGPYGKYIHNEGVTIDDWQRMCMHMRSSVDDCLSVQTMTLNTKHKRTEVGEGEGEYVRYTY